MSLRYSVLSLFAFFAILLLVFENYETWTLSTQMLPEKGATKKSVQKTEKPPEVIDEKEPPNIQSYIFISENNIFSPERKEFPIVPSPSQVKPPIVRPQVVLYGVTMADDYQSASIVNPGRPIRKGEREMMSVKVGDPIGEFKVAKILPDRIVMEAAGDSGDSFEVLLYDAKSPKQRTYAKTESKPATVTTTLPTPAAMPTAVPTPAPTPTAGPTPTMTPTQPSLPTATPPSRRLTRERSPVLPSEGQPAIGPVTPQAVGPAPPP